MKTTVLKSFILLIIMSFASSCNEDDNNDSAPEVPTYTEENFLAGYVQTTGFDQKNTDYINSGAYEFGLEFMPTVTGKITSYKVKLPDVNNALRVSLWDKTTSSIIKTDIVNVASANTEMNFDIDDLTLIKNKAYAITMNSDDWYKREKTDGTNATYPVVTNNIIITAYKWRSGILHTYPTNNSADYYAGDLSFNFIQTE